MDFPIPVKIFIPRIDELTEPTSNIQYEVIIQEERETETGEISNRITENELNIVNLTLSQVCFSLNGNFVLQLQPHSSEPDLQSDTLENSEQV